MLAIYADVGSGVCYLFTLAMVGWFLVAWSLYWLGRRLRRQPAGPVVRRAMLVTVAVAAVVLAAFPPLRKVADWRHVTTGEPIPREWANEFDRWYFGYIPSHSHVGTIGKRDVTSNGAEVTLDDRGAFRFDTPTWAVEWWAVYGEAAILALLALPFVWRGKNRGRPVDDAPAVG